MPAYLRSLTPVQLRMDTRVTNHGYRDGAATSYQAVLQSGTAVLVDDRGVPRVRCACGNPLTPPVALRTMPRQTGDSWPSYRPSNVVVVTPATTVINIFVVYDPERGDWFARHRGDTGEKDRKTDPCGAALTLGERVDADLAVALRLEGRRRGDRVPADVDRPLLGDPQPRVPALRTDDLGA